MGEAGLDGTSMAVPAASENPGPLVAAVAAFAVAVAGNNPGRASVTANWPGEVVVVVGVVQEQQNQV